MWFPVVRSAISIPPWSEGAYRVLERHWPILEAVPQDAIRPTLQGMQITGHLPQEGYSLDDLVEAVLRRREAADTAEAEPDQNLRNDEYRALVRGRAEVSRQQDFVCDTVKVPDRLTEWISQVSRVSRLREVRALQAFTRLIPPAYDTPRERLAPLSAERPTWLPAMEVIGEGVFLQIDEERLADWEASPFAASRRTMLQQSVDRRAQERGLPETAREITPRLVLLHTFAHALIDQFSLEAGYPSASLRERLYVDQEMAGILIYTATSDSAGSLGGVAAQSEPDRFEQATLGALSRLAWCSSDPVCIESPPSGTDGLNLAACHACVLLPETSCEEGNTLLDRALLLGDPEHPDEGFFSELLRAF